MLFMIHTCPERLWYVERFLIPSLVKQGVRRSEIIVWNDEDHIGNLASWVCSNKAIKESGVTGGIWHMQDDVLICGDFMQRLKELPLKKNGIICGYVNGDRAFPSNRYIHPVDSLKRFDFPDSFQCIYIPVDYSVGFVEWWQQEIVGKNRCEKMRATGKFDDWFFKRYCSELPRGTIAVWCCEPSLVQHVDKLIGGSLVNDMKKWKNRAVSFADLAAEKRLQEELSEYFGKNGETENRN